MDSIEIKLKIIRTLLKSEYPEVWAPRVELESIPDEMIRRLQEQLDEKLYDDDFQFEELMLYVGLAYEYTIENRNEDGLKQLEKGLKMCQEKTNRGETPSSGLRKALLHIMLSTKVDLLLRSEDLQTAVEVMAEIPPINEMSKQNQAAIHGLRAVFFSEYGINGSRMAVKFASKAIETDPDESLWYFLKGKFLGRLRHVERPFDVPQREEIELLEEATNLKKKCPSYLVFTAQLYRETANRIYRALRTNNSLFPDRQIVLDKLNEKSVEFYNQSIELKPECSHMLFRCAKGFITFPFPFRDEKRAKEYLDKALEKAPNSGYGNHVMAQYYERIKKEPQKAMKHLKLCQEKKVFGAVMDLLRLEHRIEGIDISAKLKAMLDVYPEKSRQCQLYSQLVSYYLFANNLPTACRYASEVIRLKVDCIDMMQHRPITVNVFETVNMYDVLIDEIKIQFQDAKCSKENKEVFEKLLKEMTWAGIPVSVTKPTNLKEEILNLSTRRITPKKHVPNSNNRGFKKKNDGARYQQYLPKTRFGHQTDIDRKMSEIFDKCREDIENKKNLNNSSVASSHDRSKQFQGKFGVPTQTASTKDKDEISMTARKVEPTLKTEKTDIRDDDSEEDSDDTAFRMKIYQRTQENLKNETSMTKRKVDPDPKTGKANVKNDDSEEDTDDTAFRMKIYQKTQETMKKLASSKLDDSTTNESEDIANSMQKMKLTGDSLKVDQDKYKNLKSRTDSNDRPSRDSMNVKRNYSSKEEYFEKASPDRKKNLPNSHLSDGNESKYSDKNKRHEYISGVSKKEYIHEKKNTSEFEHRKSNRYEDPKKRELKSSHHRDMPTGTETEDDISERETHHSKRDKYITKYEPKHHHMKRNEDDRSYSPNKRHSKRYSKRGRSIESDNEGDQKSSSSRERYTRRKEKSSKGDKSKSTRRIRSSSGSPDYTYSRRRSPSYHRRADSRERADYRREKYDKEFSKKSNQSKRESRREDDRISELVDKLSRKFEPKPLNF